MKFSPQQSDAIDAVAAWHRNFMAERRAQKRVSQPIFRIFGYAGTGKTTIAREDADRWLYTAVTRAADAITIVGRG